MKITSSNCKKAYEAICKYLHMEDIYVMLANDGWTFCSPEKMCIFAADNRKDFKCKFVVQKLVKCPLCFKHLCKFNLQSCAFYCQCSYDELLKNLTRDLVKFLMQHDISVGDVRTRFKKMSSIEELLVFGDLR